MTEAATEHNIAEIMQDMGQKARKAALSAELASTDVKNKALTASAGYLRDAAADIIAANQKDVTAGIQKGLSDAMIDRLKLDEKRIESIAASLEMIAELPDPVGRVLKTTERPNGLNITQIATALGVIGIIYESRPNVTADAGALAMKAGNAVILRGGSESKYSSAAIHKCLLKGLDDAGLDQNIIQLVPITDREAVGYMLADMADYIDIIVPRGGRSLVERVQKQARVPVLAHLEGICHSYIHASADVQKAKDIILNAKMRRTGICGATETLLVDQNFDKDALLSLLEALDAENCEIRGCEKLTALFSKAKPATQEDWSTEYLAAILSVKIVDNIDAAVDHIRHHSSGHTEAIIAEDKNAAEQFLTQINSAIVMHNASTQFADGGEFGMGAEIGIATGKIHARGPVGLEQLTCFKYQVRGSGQTRPK